MAEYAQTTYEWGNAFGVLHAGVRSQPNFNALLQVVQVYLWVLDLTGQTLAGHGRHHVQLIAGTVGLGSKFTHDFQNT